MRQRTVGSIVRERCILVLFRFQNGANQKMPKLTSDYSPQNKFSSNLKSGLKSRLQLLAPNRLKTAVRARSVPAFSSLTLPSKLRDQIIIFN